MAKKVPDGEPRFVRKKPTKSRKTRPDGYKRRKPRK
jgi:hypothetical protein